MQKPNVEKVPTVPGRIASAEQTSVILKVAGTLKSNVPLGLFQHFQGKTLFFFGSMTTTAPSTAFQGGATLCRSVTLNVSFDITFAIH